MSAGAGSWKPAPARTPSTRQARAVCLRLVVGAVVLWSVLELAMFVIDRDMVSKSLVQGVVAVSVFIPSLARAAIWWSAWRDNHFELTHSSLLVSTGGGLHSFGREEVVVAQLLGRDSVGRVLLAATSGDFPRLRVVDASGEWLLTGPLLIWRRADLAQARLMLEAFMQKERPGGPGNG